MRSLGRRYYVHVDIRALSPKMVLKLTFVVNYRQNKIEVFQR